MIYDTEEFQQSKGDTRGPELATSEEETGDVLLPVKHHSYTFQV